MRKKLIEKKKTNGERNDRENIQLSLPEPPVTPFTSVAPLVFVVVVTMIKQVGRIQRVFNGFKNAKSLFNYALPLTA